MIGQGRVFSLLPQAIRQNDPFGALRTMCDAVEADYHRANGEIKDMLVLIDPNDVNNQFILSGSLTFFHPEQVVTLTVNNPSSVTFDRTPQGVGATGAYVGFGLYVVSGNGTGQYRMIVNYDGSTRTATLDQAFDTLPTSGASFALCYPDRVWLPTVIKGAKDSEQFGTVLPAQPSLGSLSPTPLRSSFALPARECIYEVSDYYKGWFIEFLDGKEKGRRFQIIEYVGSTRTITLSSMCRAAEGDWFMLVPPQSEDIEPVTGYYTDRWLRILSGANDESYDKVHHVETRQILRSVYLDPERDDVELATHVAYVFDPNTDEGEEFSYPPTPDSFFGISNTYVSLAYLASHMGVTVDAEDHEDFQREFLRQVANLYKIKGTHRAFELMCRSLGLRAKIGERSTNYVPGPPKVDVGPGTVVPPKRYYGWSETNPPIEGSTGSSVPPEWLREEGRDLARIPSSDVEIYVTRLDPRIFVNGRLFNRLIEKLEIVRPLHVEIITFGYFEYAEDPMLMEDDYILEETAVIDEVMPLVEVTDVFIGGLVSKTSSEVASTSEVVAVRATARYDHPYTSRFSWGKTFLDTGFHVY